MKINFKLEKEDLINFSLFSYSEKLKKSKINKSIILIVTIYLAISFIPKIILDDITIEDWISMLIVSLVMFVVFFINNTIFKKLNVNIIKKSINKWNFTSSLWEYNLTIIDNNFIIQWNESETKFSINKIINIIENVEYFYLYFNSCSAYVINKNTVTWDKEKMFQYFRENFKDKTK